MTLAERRPAAAPELLAPAGNWDCARAAVANGADAIYFGLDRGFNARARAANFAIEDLQPLMQFLHQHRVKGYVTLNTLAFTDELEAIEQLVRTIAMARVDAVLVQDLGLIELIRRTAPELSIHASTQMTMTSAECIAGIESRGVDRVVVARELSVSEIREISRATKMPLETFVHGALCVAYSGQCLTSESLGGRSANRGQCAQACRLPYELVCDGEDVDLGDQKYLLSPQDLAAYALVPDLIEAGVVSLKIEGRLKTPEYVANITRHYRQAIDTAMAGQPVTFTPRQVEEMELSFSRGFSAGWLNGCDHKALVPAISSAKRGVLVGHIQRIDHQRQQVEIELCGGVRAGDGIVFEGDRSANAEQGGRIYNVRRGPRIVDQDVADGRVSLDFGRGAIDFNQLWEGQQIWKTDDPRLTRKLRRSFDSEIPAPQVPVQLSIRAAVGQRLTVTVQAEGLPAFEIESEQPLETARKHPLSDDVLAEQFGRLGGSGFRLSHLEVSIDDSPMVPLSVLGKLRRRMVEHLQEIRESSETEHSAIPLADSPVLPQLRLDFGTARGPATAEAPLDAATVNDSRLHVLARSLAQLQTLLDLNIPELYADFQDIREYREAVRLALQAGSRLLIATPRIQKPGEMGIFRAVARHQPDGVLVRNLAGLEFFHTAQIECIADFSLNAANELTVAWLLDRGAARVTTSYDLNRDQLLALVEQSRPEILEVVVHQHMPMFHMEHCVFCAVLSPGTNKTNCGRPCDFHEVKLRDRVGMEHPLKADVGCRNTLFNAVPQSAAEAVADLQQRGVRSFRVELLDDLPANELERTVTAYQNLLAGLVTGQDVWKSLQAMNRVGVTRGTLEHDRDPLAII